MLAIRTQNVTARPGRVTQFVILRRVEHGLRLK